MLFNEITMKLVVHVNCIHKVLNEDHQCRVDEHQANEETQLCVMDDNKFGLLPKGIFSTSKDTLAA